MCGVCGFTGEILNRDEVLKNMTEVITHRGPDSSGFYTDDAVSMGFRRLSIIDIAQTGDQPIYNEDHTLVLTFNGEIYNYKDLRAELLEKGHVFTTNTDSEVLIHGFEEWQEGLLNRLRGMFAFIIWDKNTKTLFGARDYFGIKPFYYAQMGNTFLFGSEIKAFLHHPDFKKELNTAALEKYRITYDVWFPESTLHQSGAVKAVVDELTSRGMTYEKDGAIWYKATEFGGEKDEVLVRANGNPTYFTADIAYHKNKFVDRHFDRVINVWGADHHGHVARLKGAMDAIGLDGSKLDIVLMQLVRLMKDGEPYRMSKRTGKSITLSDLTDLVPIDAARFFFNMREPNSTLDFDLDLAVEESSQNPVYYVQYAHARICSVLAGAAAEGLVLDDRLNYDYSLLNEPSERNLIRKLADFPDEVVFGAEHLEPHRIAAYIQDLAADFHHFYSECRLRGEDRALSLARLALAKTTARVIKSGLTAMGVAAPEKM